MVAQAVNAAVELVGPAPDDVAAMKGLVLATFRRRWATERKKIRRSVRADAADSASRPRKKRPLDRAAQQSAAQALELIERNLAAGATDIPDLMRVVNVHFEDRHAEVQVVKDAAGLARYTATYKFLKYYQGVRHIHAPLHLGLVDPR
jgi:hypothetical protein